MERCKEIELKYTHSAGSVAATVKSGVGRLPGATGEDTGNLGVGRRK